jgi:uncharacterized protein HemX
MSDNSSPISAQNHGTFTAASFVLALLALALALFTFRQVQEVGGAVAALELRDIKDDAKTVKAHSDEIAELQKKFAALEAASAAVAAAPPPAAPPAAPEAAAAPK